MPWCLIAEATRQALTSPMHPLSYTGMGQALAAHAELFEVTSEPTAKPTFGIRETKFRGEQIGVQELTMSHTPFADLVFFERVTDNPDVLQHMKKDPKVLIVPPLLGHYSTIMRETVRDMLPSHNVFIIDWADAKTVPLKDGYFDLDDQIAYVMKIIKKLGPNVHLLSVSQSSLAVFCACALLAAEDDQSQPRTMTLISGPIDTRNSGCVVNESARQCSLSWYRENQIEMVPFYYPGAFRRVYPGDTQLIHRMSMVMDTDVTEKVKYFQYLTRGDDDTPEALKRLYKEFLAVMDTTEEFYLQLMERAYKNCDLPNNAFMWHGQKVDPKAITKTAIFTVEGELDDLSPAGHTNAALHMCTSLDDKKKQSHLEIGVRHYGTFTGRRWRNNIQPMVHQFIRLHASDVENEQFYTVS